MSSTARGWRRRVAVSVSDEGLSLIELMVAIFVFALFSSAVAGMLLQGFATTRTDRQRSVAADLGAQEIDKVRDADPTTLPLGLTTSTQSVDGTTYTLARTTTWVGGGAGGSVCSAGASKTAYLRVNVAVSWPQMSGVKPVANQTLIFPKVGGYSSNNGSIAVAVNDRDGQPENGVTVSLTPSSGTAPAPQVTGTDGCAFFPSLPASMNYTAAVTAVGHVDMQGNAAPTLLVNTGTTGLPVAATFNYDNAATLNLTLQPLDALHPLPGASTGTNYPVRLANSSLLPSGVSSPIASSAGAATAAVFPYTSGFTAWAGDCVDADPGAGNRAGPFTTNQAGTTSGQLKLDGIDVTVLTSLLTPRVGVTVTAKHAADSSANSCASGDSYTVGTTDALGQVHVSIPPGKWTLSSSASLATATITLAANQATPGVVQVVG